MKRALFVALLSLCACLSISIDVEDQGDPWALEAASGGWLLALGSDEYPGPSCLSQARTLVVDDWAERCARARHETGCLGDYQGDDVIFVSPDEESRKKLIAHLALHLLARCEWGDSDPNHEEPLLWLPRAWSAEDWAFKLIDLRSGKADRVTPGE